MVRRLWWVFVTAFFLAMNALLWRSEFGGGHLLGSAVRPEVVLARMLHASDFSDLEIRHRGAKVGRCRWAAGLVETAAGPAAQQPEGMVRGIAGYTVDVDGQFMAREPRRVRFNSHLRLDTNQAVQELHLRLTFHWRQTDQPLTVSLRVSVPDDSVEITPPLFTDAAGREVGRLPLSELSHPEKLLTRLGGPSLPAALAALGLPLGPLSPWSGTPALQWEALKGHRVPWGRSFLSLYRLRLRLADRYPLTLYVTDAGEIFQADLGSELTLVNEKILALGPPGPVR